MSSASDVDADDASEAAAWLRGTPWRETPLRRALDDSSCASPPVLSLLTKVRADASLAALVTDMSRVWFVRMSVDEVGRERRRLMPALDQADAATLVQLQQLLAPDARDRVEGAVGEDGVLRLEARAMLEGGFRFRWTFRCRPLSGRAVQAAVLRAQVYDHMREAMAQLLFVAGRRGGGRALREEDVRVGVEGADRDRLTEAAASEETARALDALYDDVQRHKDWEEGRERRAAEAAEAERKRLRAEADAREAAAAERREARRRRAAEEEAASSLDGVAGSLPGDSLARSDSGAAAKRPRSPSLDAEERQRERPVPAPPGSLSQSPPRAPAPAPVPAPAPAPAPKKNKKKKKKHAFV